MDTSFVTVGGDGLYGKMASWCTQSIRYHYPNSNIFVGIPRTEQQSYPLPPVERLDISYPLPDYNPSIKAAALHQAERASNSKRIVFVDTDTILLDRISIPEGDGLSAKPANIDNLWPRNRKKNWQAVYDRIGVEPPQGQTTTTVDNRDIWPYYNAAVFAETGIKLAEDWLAYQTALRNWGPDNYFTGQVALAVAASQEKVMELTEQQNYPLSLRYYVPKDTELIHYQQPQYLLKTWGHRNILKQIGIWDDITSTWDFRHPWIRTLWDWGQVTRNRFRWISGKYDTVSAKKNENN